MGKKWNTTLANSYGFDFITGDSELHLVVKRMLPNSYNISPKSQSILNKYIKFELPKQEKISIFESIQDGSKVLAFNSQVLVIMIILKQSIKVCIVDYIKTGR